MNIDVTGDWLHINSRKIQKVDCETNKFTAGKNTCEYVIIHGTAGTTPQSAHNNFQNPDSQVSWHLTIDRAGIVYQLYDFRKITWHAGKSSWHGVDGLNKCSIGIELVNAGPLTIKDGMFYTWSKNKVLESDVWYDKDGNPFQSYTPQQIQVCKEIVVALAKHYRCRDVLGHINISPGRKTDPYPQGMAEIVNPVRRLMGTI